MTPILELQDVSLSFTDNGFHQEILKQVNLKIYAGDSVVLLGPSGEGKSLLLRLLGNLVSPSSGKVLWDGQDAATMPHNKRIQWLRKIGMLFQRNALFDSLTVSENVAFPLMEVTNLTKSEIFKRVDTYLYSVNLLESKKLYPNELSGGMQKRLGIARALALEPQIILYDDPTAGLDPLTSRHIVQLIQNLRRTFKTTTVTVTNDMNRAFQIAGRIFFVLGGELIETGDKNQTLKFPDERVQQFIHGRSEGPLSQFA